MRKLHDILDEVIKTRHFKDDSYGKRVTDAWTDAGSLDSKVIASINKRIRFLEDIEFNIPSSGLGIKIFTSADKVYYDDYPKEPRDWGVDLWLIIKGNKIITSYWKPTHLKPVAGDFIDILALKNKIKEKNIGTKRNPIKINLLK